MRDSLEKQEKLQEAGGTKARSTGEAEFREWGRAPQTEGKLLALEGRGQPRSVSCQKVP